MGVAMFPEYNIMEFPGVGCLGGVGCSIFNVFKSKEGVFVLQALNLRVAAVFWLFLLTTLWLVI